MNALEMYPVEERLPHRERVVFTWYAVTVVALYLAMMLVGLTMRLTQATWADVGPHLFYELLTMHGTAMVANTASGALAVMWFFLRKYVPLHTGALIANYALFVGGLAVITASVFWGNFAGMWTMLYPLPMHSMTIWSDNAAAAFIVGTLMIGIGTTVVFVDAALAISKVYGNPFRAMGLQWLFGGRIDPAHPKTVVAATAIIIADSIGILAGAIIMVMMLLNIYAGLHLNALFAKELTYWFGHMFINATIFMAVIGVFELLPRYTGKPIPITRPFLWAWAIAGLLVIVVFPHHLFMDAAQPRWMAIMGQVASYGEGFPVYLATAYEALRNIHHSRIRWTMPACLIALGMFGWSAGIVPAILDGTIDINRLMHNTDWVPGHFHFYLILGVLPMLFAFFYHLIGERKASRAASRIDGFGFPVYLIGGIIFVLAFLDAGRNSVPRRYAVHIAEWVPYDQAGSVGAILVVLGMCVFFARIIVGMLQHGGHPAPAPRGGALPEPAPAARATG
ncbi:MAG TPA: cbb3-type cytochrome c oxidase subunit I [Rhodanobacteraceae bacterium]|nr:cbb3-type cytochrome c oxidase subunit I [Rhodanobacteraceae bacterium]